MHESSTAVLVGGDVELWSISRTPRGFSCLRTVYAGAALRVHAVLATSDWCALPDDPDAVARMIERLPISRPTSSAGCSVTRPVAAVGFFVGERLDVCLREQAERLVGAVAPLLEVVG